MSFNLPKYSFSGIDNNPKLGFYRVGQETFYGKPLAYLRAEELGLEPSWHFNAAEFARVDWYAEPESDIRELYRLRAQQLRDTYDYIRLDLSGGSDSATVLYSFVLNNIHLDEVVFRYPKSGEKNAIAPAYDNRPENTLGEWQYAAQPMLNWIAINYPKIKITFYDYSEKMLAGEYLQDESWIFTTRDWFQPGHSAKHDIFGAPGHQAQADSGKTICVLHGVDKPRIALIDNNWYVYFVDVFANQPSPIKNNYDNITHELFFWTPDFPEIVVKQGHLIKNYFDMPHHRAVRHLVKYPVLNPNNRTAYEMIVKSIIYPDFDPLTWQTTKATNSFYNEMDHWFYQNFADTDMYKNWQAGLDFLVKNLDSTKFMYKSNIPVGLRWNKSIFYHLGSSDGLATDPVFKNQSYFDQFREEITVFSHKKLHRLLV